MTTPIPYEHLDETWERALAVVAHPDDLEWGGAAAIARWTGQGKTVVYCMVTSGEAGIDGLHPDLARDVREAEQVESAARVGVHVVEFLGLADGVLQHDLVLRRAVSAAVRRHRPEVVITNNFRNTWDGARALNQADHIATGRATLDAVRDASNRWVFPEDELEPWGGVRQVWAMSSPRSTHAVDVTATFEAGVASLQAHQAYIDGLGGAAFDPEEFLDGMGRAVGTRLGVRHATAFEVFTF